MTSRQQAESFPGRNFYHARGVEWAKFLPLLAITFIIAVVLAELMALLFRSGNYFIIVVPLFAALALGGTLSLAVRHGHCRNTLVTGAAGVLAALVLYLGYFYGGMLHDFGPQFAAHPELLPAYIRLRMASEVTQDIHESSRDKPRDATTADNYANWARSGIELLLVLVITPGLALRRARRPYCAACRRWMIREASPFEPSVADSLVQAFRDNSARSLAALCAHAPFNTIPNLTLAADFCPSFKDGNSRDCPVYVSLKQITVAPKKLVTDTFEQSKGKMLVENLQLETSELPALAPRFKFLETITGRSAVAALMPEPESERSAERPDGVFAEINPLPADHRGKILTRKTKLVGNAGSLAIFILFFGSMGLLLWGIWLGFPDHPPAEGVSPAAKTVGIALIATGISLFVVALGIAMVDISFLGNRYLRRMLRQELARRTSCLVDLSDPDAVFVEVVPKMNWGKLMLDNASDVGLLVVDRQRREIRFEGDNERWRIPATAITGCRFEKYVQRQGHSKSQSFYAVLNLNHPGGFWEAPIRQRGRHSIFSRNRKKETFRLVEAIQGIRGLKEPALTPV